MAEHQLAKKTENAMETVAFSGSLPGSRFPRNRGPLLGHWRMISRTRSIYTLFVVRKWIRADGWVLVRVRGFGCALRRPHGMRVCSVIRLLGSPRRHSGLAFRCY